MASSSKASAKREASNEPWQTGEAVERLGTCGGGRVLTRHGHPLLTGHRPLTTPPVLWTRWPHFHRSTARVQIRRIRAAPRVARRAAEPSSTQSERPKPSRSIKSHSSIKRRAWIPGGDSDFWGVLRKDPKRTYYYHQWKQTGVPPDCTHHHPPISSISSSVTHRVPTATRSFDSTHSTPTDPTTPSTEPEPLPLCTCNSSKTTSSFLKAPVMAWDGLSVEKSHRRARDASRAVVVFGGEFQAGRG